MSLTRAREILARMDDLAEPTCERLAAMAAHVSAAAAVTEAEAAQTRALVAVLDYAQREPGTLLTYPEERVVAQKIRTLLGLPAGTLLGLPAEVPE